VENKKIDVLFGLAAIAFLVVTFILIKEFNAQRVNDYKEYTATITHLVNMKNNKIRVLANLLVIKEKENEDLKNTLTETRNGLEGLTKKLAQPASVAAPAPTAK